MFLETATHTASPVYVCAYVPVHARARAYHRAFERVELVKSKFFRKLAPWPMINSVRSSGLRTFVRAGCTGVRTIPVVR